MWHINEIFLCSLFGLYHYYLCHMGELINAPRARCCRRPRQPDTVTPASLIFSYASVSCACAGQPKRPWPSQFRSESASAGSNGDQTVSVKLCPRASDREDPVRVTNEPEPTSLSQLSSGSLAVTVTVAEIHSCLSTLTRLLRVERLAPGHRDEPEPPSLADRGGAAP